VPETGCSLGGTSGEHKNFVKLSICTPKKIWTGLKEKLHSFLSSALNGGEGSASHPRPYNPG